MLADRILEQPEWRTWLESSRREALSGLRRKIDATTDLQDALQRRSEAAEPAAKAALEAEIKSLCGELGKDEKTFAEGQVMSDEDYAQTLAEIARQIDQKLKSLTQQAIERARLRRLQRR
ncbi:hypothetical protein D3C86_1602690 [compost metagenome]